jgi:hypothetical protein
MPSQLVQTSLLTINILRKTISDCDQVYLSSIALRFICINLHHFIGNCCNKDDTLHSSSLGCHLRKFFCTIKLVHMDLMPEFLEIVKLQTQSMNNVRRGEK